jgi:methylenetetrahydrofolate reductase (NADPH)
MASLFEHFGELVRCGPSFFTCTYGAGGSTRDRTLELLDWVRTDYPDVPIASHLTCVGATGASLREYIRAAAAKGSFGIVALRGDTPADPSYKPAPDGLRYANELVAMIRDEFPDLSIIVAGYPEKHPEAPSMEIDLENLKRKVDAGADAVISQLFYDNEDFFRFRDQCDRAGIQAPIIPGLLPVTNLAQIKRITTLCGAKLTDRLLRRLEAHAEDEEGQFSVGVYYAARQVEELVEQGAPGVHFYVMNKSRAAAMICRALTLDRQRR